MMQALKYNAILPQPMQTLLEHSEYTMSVHQGSGFSTHTGSVSRFGDSREGSAVTLRGRCRGQAMDILSASCNLTRGRHTHVLVDEEHVHVGKVKWQVYLAIARALGGRFSVVIVAAYILYHVTSVAGNYWLGYWTDNLQSAAESDEVTPAVPTAQESSGLFLAVYAFLGAGQCVTVIVSVLLLAVSRIRASRFMHAKLLSSILASPLHFFHRNPAARMLNRMSRDLEVVDKDLWWALEVVLDCACQVLSTCILVCISFPFYLLTLIPVAAAYFCMQRYYIGTSRQLRRLDGKTRSLVFSHISEMVNGAPLLRAAGDQALEQAHKTAASLMDGNGKYSFASNTAIRWLGVRVAALGVIVVGVATVFGVAFRNTMTGGLVGLTIMYTLDVTENLNWLVRMVGDLETEAVSVERILEYSNLTPEGEHSTYPIWMPQATWPSHGGLQFVNLSASHRSDSPLVLKNIDCVIKPGEKIGVVGRTGAGKTSLWSAMLGFMTSSSGSILIDDVDTRSVPLQELRTRITVMTQEPLILDGPVRENLDPEGKSTDDELWTVLEKTKLANRIRSLPGGLDYCCLGDGHGFSAGQRQQLCLARVLLRHSRLLILDEATSSLDRETNDFILDVVKTACADSTVLFVTHRLSAVMHCDRVMVLDQGRLVEMDTAQRLLEDPFSLFSRLAAML